MGRCAKRKLKDEEKKKQMLMASISTEFVSAQHKRADLGNSARRPSFELNEADASKKNPPGLGRFPFRTRAVFQQLHGSKLRSHPFGYLRLAGLAITHGQTAAEVQVSAQSVSQLSSGSLHPEGESSNSNIRLK